MMLSFVFAVAALSQTFDAEVIPKAQAEIASACGTSPAISVTWGDFGDDEDAAAGLTQAGLGFLSSAFGGVCSDASLKTAIGQKVSKIVLTQAYGATDPVIYLTGGTLHIEYLWVKGQAGPDVAFVRDEIISRLKGEEAEAL
jgi:hypothetical protein